MWRNISGYKMIQFRDAQKMQKDFPASFTAPSTDDLRTVTAGHTVKVCTGGERFWVQVLRVNGDHITARIDSALVSTAKHGLRYGDKIRFEKKNIYDLDA